MKIRYWAIAVTVIGHAIGVSILYNGFKHQNIFTCMAGLVILTSPIDLWPEAYGYKKGDI